MSRQHALIFYFDGTVHLKDVDSKFGTFVMIRHLKKLKPKKQLVVQIERKVFFLKVE